MEARLEPKNESRADGKASAKSNGRANGRGDVKERAAAAPSGNHNGARNGASAAKNGPPAPSGKLGVAEVLAARKRAELRELYVFWSGDPAARGPEQDDRLRDALAAWMADPERIAERAATLGRRLCEVLEALVAAPRYRRTWTDLANAKRLAHLSSYDLEACIVALARHGFLVDGARDGNEQNGARIVAVPTEIGDGILRQRQQERGVFQALTLRGHLDRHYGGDKGRLSPQRVREMYKMYAQETACAARVERLPEGVKGLVEKAILEFGGILPRHLFERMDTELPHWNGRRWRMILEQSLVGTVQELSLARYGIHHDDETLIVFNEVALAWLRRVAVPSDPDRPHEELSLGIDLSSNIARFLAYIQENDVRFTVRGEIFKTTEKKIIQHLIPNPGRELAREEVLGFIFAFCRGCGLIDKTGERTFAVTPRGREWVQLALREKQSTLLDFALLDRSLGGEPFHQQRMRQIFLRLLKRVEPDVWYDLMYLPFLARNGYLSKLDDLGVEEHFAEHAQGAQYSGLEDPQRLAWNLVRWVRQRLYLLGFVDLGYDASRRPVAMRLTHAGARLFGLDDDNARGAPEAVIGNLVVTPDFEVVMFPTGDDAELVHDLDRFCRRDRHDEASVVHFRITEEGVRRALTDGMSLPYMLRTLELHSRTPVPQNVHFSIRDWATRAGLMTLDSELLLTCHDPETLRRFRQDAGTRPYIEAVTGETTVQLKGRITPRRMRSLLRELGYLVELVEER